MKEDEDEGVVYDSVENFEPNTIPSKKIPSREIQLIQNRINALRNKRLLDAIEEIKRRENE